MHAPPKNQCIRGWNSMSFAHSPGPSHRTHGAGARQSFKNIIRDEPRFVKFYVEIFIV
jgi:hypothetical protein